MRLLGIESSCDETAIAIVTNGTVVESSIISSSKDIYAESGGVIPEDAARHQLEYILPVLHKCFHKADCSMDDIDAIAVTHAPGLMGSLLVGVTTARTLSSIHKIPLVGVHHTFGHLCSICLDTDTHPPKFPCMTLSASGGHTEIWYRKTHTDHILVAHTIDDAAGEAFDKGATMLGLPYPGGPSIAALAMHGDESSWDFPKALSHKKTLDMSFSGLKTALRYAIQDTKDMNEEAVRNFAAAYQYAICLQLVDRLFQSSTMYPDIQEIHVVGGVSANQRLRDMIAERIPHIPLRTPAKMQYCTDNAAMIASAGYFVIQQKGDAAYSPFTTTTNVLEC